MTKFFKGLTFHEKRGVCYDFPKIKLTNENSGVSKNFWRNISSYKNWWAISVFNRVFLQSLLSSSWLELHHFRSNWHKMTKNFCTSDASSKLKNLPRSLFNPAGRLQKGSGSARGRREMKNNSVARFCFGSSLKKRQIGNWSTFRNTW